jgi:hypothetical protein
LLFKALRETVKRMAADLRSGLSSLGEQGDSLRRVTERLTRMDDDEDVERGAEVFFHQQEDDEILVPDRPDREALPAAVLLPGNVGADNYMLSRYFSEASPTNHDSAER